MFGFMDSQLNMRRILICNFCWILLSFLHVGVYCQISFEVSGPRLVNAFVNFNCSYDSGSRKQFYMNYEKNGISIALIVPNDSPQNEINATFKDRVDISTQSELNSNSYSMVLNNLQCSDEGDYTCKIDVGSKVPSVRTLLVESMPQAPTLTAPTDFMVLGDNVTVECTAIVGKPARNLTLCVRQETGPNCIEASPPVDLGNCSFSRKAVMTLNITEGTNQATCIVSPSEGNNLEATKNWQVYYPVLDIKFVPDNSAVRLTEGESLTINCEARGKPSPSFSWEFQPADDQLNTITLESRNLVLSPVEPAQNGVYTCIASNIIRNVTYNMTKSITVIVVPTTPAPTTTTTAPTTEKVIGGVTGKVGPAPDEKKDGWKLIVGIVCAILFLIILIILLVILYRRRSKPAEIEEPPEKPRNNHEVNMKETKPDLVYSTGIEKGKLPMYNTNSEKGFDHNGEDDLYYAELAFDDKPRSRKPIVPLYENSSNNDPYTTVMPQV